MTAVEFLESKIFGDEIFSLSKVFEQAKEMEKQQIIETHCSKEELFKIIDDFCFDWNYNYKGELSQKEYLIEWFKNFKSKSDIKKEPNSFTKEDVRQAWLDSERNMRATFSSSTYKETAFEQWLENRIKSNQ